MKLSRVDWGAEIGAKIRQLRKEKGLTQMDLARKAGLSRATIQNYERNATEPIIETVVQFAIGLGVDLEEILPDGYYQRAVSQRLRAVEEAGKAAAADLAALFNRPSSAASRKMRSARRAGPLRQPRMPLLPTRHPIWQSLPVLEAA